MFPAMFLETVFCGNEETHHPHKHIVKDASGWTQTQFCNGTVTEESRLLSIRELRRIAGQ